MVPAVSASDISFDAWPKVLQIGSAVFVRLLLSSNIDDEGRRCAAGRESQIPLRDATVLAADPAFACPTICEYGPRDSRSGIRLRAFSNVAHSAGSRDPSSPGDNFQSSAPRFRSAMDSGCLCEWVLCRSPSGTR